MKQSYMKKIISLGIDPQFAVVSITG